MSADQQADQLDNRAGTPPETVPPSAQELSSDVNADVDATASTETQADGPDPVDNNPTGISSTVDAWPHEDHHREVVEGPKIREVALLADETPVHIFSASGGLTSEPPPIGQLLVVTNQRVIAFCHAEGKQETYLVPVDQVKHVVVKAGSRSASMLLQGSMMVVAGIFIYLVLGYWLTNQIEGPTIPVLHMDVAPFISLIIVLAGLTMIAQVYFTKPDGTVTIQGDGLQFVFPFQGDAAQRQIFDVVNTAFATRQTRLQEELQLEVANSPPSGTVDDPPSPWASSAEGQPRIDV